MGSAYTQQQSQPDFITAAVRGWQDKTRGLTNRNVAARPRSSKSQTGEHHTIVLTRSNSELSPTNFPCPFINPEMSCWMKCPDRPTPRVWLQRTDAQNPWCVSQTGWSLSEPAPASSNKQCLQTCPCNHHTDMPQTRFFLLLWVRADFQTHL